MPTWFFRVLFAPYATWAARANWPLQTAPNTRASSNLISTALESWGPDFKLQIVDDCWWLLYLLHLQTRLSKSRVSFKGTWFCAWFSYVFIKSACFLVAFLRCSTGWFPDVPRYTYSNGSTYEGQWKMEARLFFGAERLTCCRRQTMFYPCEDLMHLDALGARWPWNRETGRWLCLWGDTKDDSTDLFWTFLYVFTILIVSYSHL